MSYNPVMVPADTLRFDEHNPREVDPERLRLIGQSLRKLGFLLPLYAEPGGKLLSGHQRWTAACQMGLPEVPVVFVDIQKNGRTDPEVLSRLNYLFNRATNDFVKGADGQAGTEVEPDWPDLDPDSSEFFRCLNASHRPVQEVRTLLLEGQGRNHSGVAQQLHRIYGVTQPVVVTPTRVVNGVGRLQAAVNLGVEAWPVVEIEEREAAYAGSVLNQLSMDYSYTGQLADQLRYGARRLGSSREVAEESRVTGAQTFALRPKVGAYWDVKRPENARRWIRQYGHRILDFGAGRDKSSQALRSIGVAVDLFEPFVVSSRRWDALPDRETAIPGLLMFLESVRSARWSSIFLNGVFQAIPFDSDRQHVVTLLAALSGPSTAIYSESVIPAKILKNTQNNAVNFPGVQQTDDSGISTVVNTFTYKTQSCLDKREFARLFVEGFESVKVRQTDMVDVIARGPKPVDPERLKAAIEFEFDLPYPNGERMGLVDEALGAFGERLGIDLS